VSPEPLDLSGEHELEEEEPKKKRARGGDEAPGARTRRRHEGELRGRLSDVFERLAEWLEGRGDAELAGIIREDSKAMVGGLVSLTRPAAWLRPPMLAALSVVEPVLAFGRVLRVLGGRWAERRARIALERQEAELAAAYAAEAEAGSGEQEQEPAQPWQVQ
jgi:hypothetical protein